MNLFKVIIMTAKIIAIFIFIAYAVGLFRTYDILQAAILLIIAAIMSLEFIFLAKQATKSGSEAK